MKKILLIGICGRSRCGKDSVAQRIASVNKNVLHINMDIYFKGKTECKYNGFDCWEHTGVIYFDRLYELVSSLKNGYRSVIKDRSLWYGSYDCEISSDDLRKKSVVIVQGYTLFTDPKLTALFDNRIFIKISNENIIKRRPGEYTKYVVIPVSEEYASQCKAAEKTFDSNTFKVDLIADDLVTYINIQLNANAYDEMLKIPSCNQAWQVLPGDILSDHEWHSIDFHNLKGWVKRRNSEILAGVTLKGNTFEYRGNGTCYWIRLRKESDYYKHIYRYTLEPTLSKIAL